MIEYNYLDHLNEGSKNQKPKKNFYNLIIETRDFIAQARKTEINFSEPFLWLNSNAVFYPRTINVIQGKAGVHKSRLAETICSAILKAMNCEKELLGFLANEKFSYNVCYVDTERNIKDQFPYALRQIMINAGHDPAIDLENFDAISLLEIEREDRFTALEEYITETRMRFKEHIVIVLDVITDCINSFNDTKESMKLIDMMNHCINKHDVTFICLIHENPGTGFEKARGHLGTEITNKATTVIQVGFEKDATGNPLDILKIHFVKCRNTRKHSPTYAYFSELEKGLVLADQSAVAEMIEAKREKATLEEVKSELTILLTGPMKKTDLYEHLTKDLRCSDSTINTRLKEIISKSIELKNMQKQPCILKKTTVDREIVFSLEQIMVLI